MNYLFVYGTLKRGFRANFMLKNEEFIGSGVTKEKFVMLPNSVNEYPILYSVHNKGFEIAGEVYKVSDDTLKELDVYEGVPEIYMRRDVEVILEDSTIINAQAYVSPEYKENLDEKAFLKSWEKKDNFDYLLVLKNDIALVKDKCQNALEILNLDYATLFRVSDDDIEMLEFLKYNENYSKNIISLKILDKEIEAILYKIKEEE